MSTWKRFLLLGSLGLTLLAGLLFTTATSGSHIASAAGCNSPVTGSWSNNSCLIGIGSPDSNDVTAIQEVITFSQKSFNGQSCGALVQGVDGAFGVNTQAAVKCFQGAMGFSPVNQDGVVGTMTWGSLESILVCQPLSSPNQTLNCTLPGVSSQDTRFKGASGGTGVWSVFDRSDDGAFCEMLDNFLC